MSPFLEALGAIATGANGLWKDFWGMKRQDDYKDWLAQREDTAVQRRAADLEAAGLSKTLAAGSAANSGVVSISGPSGGAAADALNGALQMASIRNARQENANMKKSNEVMEHQIEDLDADAAMKNANAAYAIKNSSFLDQQIAESAQRIKESIMRSQGYEYDAEAKHAAALLTGLQFKVFRDTGVSPSMNGALGDVLRRIERLGKNNGSPVFNYESKPFVWKK